MIQVNKKVMKVNEFPAHKGKINCAMIGPKSGQTIVTGGDDKVVNIWNMFRNGSNDTPQAPIFRLLGHSSAVHCVAFDRNEECIVAGSEKGSIRMWDLGTFNSLDSTLPSSNNVNQNVRVFGPGHKSCVTCVDFHPFGSYFASGSSDTNVKVWDIRTRSNLQTYKGHDSGVTSLKFTPDGRMLVAGLASGAIKVWDLTSSKEVSLQVDNALTHKKAVTNIQFHPVELLFTSGSADKTVKFWEMDEKGIYHIASTELTSAPVQTLQFIGIDEVNEYVTSDDTSNMHLLCAANDGIRVYNDWDKRHQESPTLQALNNVSIKWPGICDMKVVAPSKGKSPNIFGVSTQTQGNVGYVSVWVVLASKLSERSTTSYRGDDSPAMDSPVDVFTVNSKRENRRNTLNQSLTSDVLNEVRSETFIRETNTPPPKTNSPSPPASRGATDDLFEYDDPSDNASSKQPQRKLSPKDSVPVKIDRAREDTEVIIPAKRDQPVGLKPDDFVAVSQDISELSDEQVISQLLNTHDKVCSVMQARLTNMKLIEKLWSQNSRDVREAMKLVVNQFGKHKDHALAVDVLRIVMRPDYVKRYLNLDICVMLLPLVKDLCNTRFEEYIILALHTATQLFQSFSQIISQTLRNYKEQQSSNQVDLSAEDRKDKCETCQNAFNSIRQLCERKFTHKIDDIGTHARVYVKTLGNFGK
jgi:katanin p80 WD40 repeat-containing subunit B1